MGSRVRHDWVTEQKMWVPTGKGLLFIRNIEKRWIIRKDTDAGKDWRQEEKAMTEDEMVGWYHRLIGHEFEKSSGSWWWTGKPGVLQSMGSQRVGHDWVTDLNASIFSGRYLSVLHDTSVWLLRLHCWIQEICLEQTRLLGVSMCVYVLEVKKQNIVYSQI